MRRKKMKITAVCMMMAAGLMLASCGIADAVNLAVTEIVQEATGFAFDEMGGGPVVDLASGEAGDHENLYVNLVNNAISIRFHGQNNIRVSFSPPTTGQYVTPIANFNSGSNSLEVTEPSSNITLGNNNRPGVLTVYLPENAAAFTNMQLRTANGAVRIVGDDGRMAASIEITVVNGMVELRDFSADTVSARSTNGTVSGNSLAADMLTLNTTNGVITLRDSQVSGDLIARTVNGGVTIENVDADMDRADVNAVNGVVTIR